MKLLDQKKTIEREDWDNLMIFDACRYDYFEKIYLKYLKGELKKAHNRGISYTFDWFDEMFDGKYDAVLYTAAPFAVRENFAERWTYTDHFVDVVGHQDIDFDHEKGTSPPKLINEAVRKHDWNGKRVIRYLQPHPPFLDTPLEELTRGKGKIQRTEQALVEGRITEQGLRDAYEKNVRVAFEGAVDLIPDLDGTIVITSDHGTALNENSYLFHTRSHPEMPCLNHVPWFAVEEVK